MEDTEQAIFRKCAWRLIPFMGLLYVVNFLDRVNVSFAALAMNRDIGLSAHAYGVGAGVFFIGYFFFEVPSNVILEKVGARLWIFRIMLSWGLISMATAWARDPWSFAALRFLLGLCEAGFFPGMMLYLTYWFPASTRGQFNALFLSAILVANIIGGPLSGLILTRTGGLGGLHGWQWLFVIEGLPSCILAFAVLRFLPDRPARAAWLDAREKDIVTAALARDAVPHGRLRDCLADWRIWVLAFADLGIITALYGIGLWLPQIIKALGFSDIETGFVVALPYLVTVFAMILWAQRSDRNGERIWHVAWPALFGAAGLIASAMLGGSLWSVATLTIACVGIYAALVVFWTLPQSFLGGTAAAGAIALVNSIANLGGFFGPTIAGYLKEATGGYGLAMDVFASGLIATAVVVLMLGRALPAARRAFAVD
jgi:ACS family tartrate transporter-like MFS transporter